ncbi:Mur ligase family protein [Anaerococcus sp. NML200574]|uniref:Mur ligase family protein n=1 Tax=Anaerococcus sp. NML200574 TaxID=2954486 RepID=UPI002237AD9A|nr:Mur ligase family protein [Anaerococcus sp. NML200574]MCW6677882.1 Mur ligase family protein [Anaerococcus sp. NML200574]
MSLKSKLVKVLAKSIRSSLRLLNRNATSLPGYIAYKLDKDILKELSKNTKFIFVTGTNGKTMTTHFLVSILKEKYPIVLTNESGSNMVQGIITSLLDNPSDKESVAVLEVDEANLVRIGNYLKADYIALTNIFRDQMDRFGEIYNILDKIIEGIDLMPDAKIIANGDLPLFSYDSLSRYNPIYFAIRENEDDAYVLDAEFNSDGILCPHCHSVLKYKSVNYSSLGDFSCPNCDFKSPKIKYRIDKITEENPDHSEFVIDGYNYEVNVGGKYNIYNALTAISVARELGVSQEKIKEGLKKQKNVFGRQENIKIKDKNLIINLVKNPTGLNQVIDLMLLEDKDISLICLLNDNYADGLDVSWIYDANYEKLKKLNIKKIYVSGMRSKDMKRRLEIAELIDQPIVEFDYENEIYDVIDKINTSDIYVLSTYTAMLRLREVLDL